MELHKKISQVREVKKISRAEMASALNMSSQSYWNVETGKTELTVNRLLQIAQILGVNVIELLTGEVLKEGKKESDEVIKQLSRRVEELEEVVALLKQDNNRLSHFFLNKFQDKLKINIENELIKNERILYDEDLRSYADKIVKTVTITIINHKQEKKITVSPLVASIYSFLIGNTTDNKVFYDLHYSKYSYSYSTSESVEDVFFLPSTLVNTSELSKTSEAILAYVEGERARDIALFKACDISIEEKRNSEMRLLNFEKFAKYLTLEYESLLKNKRKLFDENSNQYVRYELNINDDGWLSAYKYFSENFNKMPSSLRDDLISTIIDSGVIKDGEFLSVFYSI